MPELTRKHLMLIINQHRGDLMESWSHFSRECFSNKSKWGNGRERVWFILWSPGYGDVQLYRQQENQISMHCIAMGPWAHGRTLLRILLFRDLFSPIVELQSAGGHKLKRDNRKYRPLSWNAPTSTSGTPRSFISTRKIGLCTKTFRRQAFSPWNTFAGSKCCTGPSDSQIGKF